jgi:hypothetical protein
MELRRIILMDEILDTIVDRTLPKYCKISRASHDRMPVEDLWSTIWGKVVTLIRVEILHTPKSGDITRCVNVVDNLGFPPVRLDNQQRFVDMTMI